MKTTKVKNSTPKLTRTKQASTSSPRSYTPRASLPRNYNNSRGGTNGMSGMINTAAAHPAETLGYLGGLMAGNYIERGHDKFQDSEENRIRDGILSKFAQPVTAPQEPLDGDYGRLDMNTNEQGYLASESPATTSDVDIAGGFDDAARAAGETRQLGQQMAMSGQPMTAAAINAMGLSPVDQAKQAVVDSRKQDYAENGPNASQARRQEERLYQKAAQAQNMDIATMPLTQIEALIDQELAGSKMSWTHKQRAKENLLKDFQVQREQQANSQVLDMYSKYLTMDPFSEEGKRHAQNMALKASDFAKAGHAKIAAMAMEPLLQQRANEQKLRQAQAMKQLEAEAYLNKRLINQAYPAARGGSRTSSGGSGGSGRGRSGSSKEFDLEKELLRIEKEQRSLASFIDKNTKEGVTLSPESQKEVDRARKKYKENENLLEYYQDPDAYEEKRQNDAFWFYSTTNKDE